MNGEAPAKARNSWALGVFRSFYHHAAPPDDDETSKHIAWFLATFAIVLTMLAVAAFAMAVSTVGPLPPDKTARISVKVFLTLLGLYLLVGASAFAGGGFLGFLFGIPRVRSAQVAQASDEGGVDSNTNLEQVSDWLTKIVVGVTLVQFHQINDLLVSFSDQVDRSLVLAPGLSVPGAGFAASLIMIGSSIAGFLAAYLKAKTDLIEAFGSVLQRVRSAIGSVAQEAIEKAARGILDRPSDEPTQALKEAAAKLIQSAPAQSRNPEVLKLAGLGQALLKNFAAAAENFQRAAELSGNSDLRGLAARAYALAGKPVEAENLSQTELPPPPKPLTTAQVETALSAMFTALYNSREGYVRAISVGERLTEDDEAKKSSRLWIYLAAAYGQQHAALVAAVADEPAEARQERDAALKSARDKALNAVQMALKLDRDKNRPLLNMLWDPNSPGKPKEENDLESFYTDQDFRSLLTD